MTADQTHSLTCANPSCLGPFLLTILDEQKTLLDKVDTIYQAFKNGKLKVDHSSKENVCRACVDEIILALQLKYPDKTWTSEAFAEKIGCSASAVRQTKEWKAYQRRCQIEKQNAHLTERGTRDK